MRTCNGVGVTSRKTSNAIHHSPQVNKSNLQIIPFNTNDVQLGREEDYDLVNSMKEKPLKGGNNHEQMITFEPSSLQGEAKMELAMTQVEKTKGITSAISLEDVCMNGVVSFGSGSLRESGENHRGYGLGGGEF